MNALFLSEQYSKLTIMYALNVFVMYISICALDVKVDEGLNVVFRFSKEIRNTDTLYLKQDSHSD
jgi:hypothetical protein